MIFLFAFASQSDQQKFEQIYQRYKKLLFYKAHEILHDSMLAEDAVSEAMIRIYQNLHKIDDPADGRTAAFVVTIVRNTALTILKKEKKHAVDVLDETRADDFDLEASVIDAMSSEQIYAAVERLGEELKSVFLMCYAYDMPHREIGKALGISENNVTVRLHRARKKLSAILTKEGTAHEAHT